MPNVHAHPPDDVLSDFVLGKLDGAADAEVESHLAACPACAERGARPDTGDTLVELLAAAGTKLDAESRTAPPGAAETPSLVAATRAYDGAAADAPADPPAALADHPKYRAVRPLGGGGMGAVWLVEHAVMGRLVAVKVIRPDLLARPGAAARFLCEVRAAAKLHHPNIVTAFDAEEAGDSCLLVMEYVEGPTLADWARGGPLPVAEACRAVRDAARGLAHAHALGLIHRDVKPHNLIRAADGTVKVLDFGLVGACVPGDAPPAADGLTGAGAVCGTPAYIAPEQIDDPRAADARSDIYALGCTLHHLLAGRPPFAGRSVNQTLAAHRTRPPEPVPGLPGPLAAVLARMLAKRPEDRFPTAGAVADALEPFCAPVETPRWRKRAVAVALAALAAAVLAAGVWVVVRDKDGKEVARVEVPDGGKVEVAPNPPKAEPPAPAPADLSKPGVLQYQPPDGRRVYSAHIGPDGRTFLVSRGGRTELFDTATGAKLREFPGWIGYYTLGGAKVLCAGPDNRLARYDRATGERDRTFGLFKADIWQICPIGPDAAQVLVTVADRTHRLFDVTRGDELLSTEFKGDPLFTFTADGKAVLIREPFDTAYKAYDPATGKPVKGFEALAKRALLGPFSADGTRAQSWDGKETRIVRASDGEVVGTVPARPDGAFEVGYTPDRTATLLYRANGELELRDSITGAVRSALKVEFPGRRDRLLYLSTCAASPDGRFALLVTADGHVAVVRLPNPKPQP